jgi:hypothetical protein
VLQTKVHVIDRNNGHQGRSNKPNDDKKTQQHGRTPQAPQKASTQKASHRWLRSYCFIASTAKFNEPWARPQRSRRNVTSVPSDMRTLQIAGCGFCDGLFSGANVSRGALLLVVSRPEAQASRLMIADVDASDGSIVITDNIMHPTRPQAVSLSRQSTAEG